MSSYSAAKEINKGRKKNTEIVEKYNIRKKQSHKDTDITKKTKNRKSNKTQ